MDFKPMFPSLNVLWTRWSAYQIKPHQWGGEYLLPAEGATDLTYNCAEQPGPLVADGSGTGAAAAHGSTGQKPPVCRFCGPLWALGPECREGGRGYGKTPNVPPCYRPLNSWEYGEDVSFFQSSFVMLYQHFLTVQGELVPTPNPKVMDLSGLLSYRLTSGPNPQLVWEVRSLESVIRFAYASMISAESIPLKVCKNCGKVYYNTHAKSEFCGTKCRNYYNVKVFREKESGQPRNRK
mgnify:CR=1 FL=1